MTERRLTTNTSVLSIPIPILRPTRYKRCSLRSNQQYVLFTLVVASSWSFVVSLDSVFNLWSIDRKQRRPMAKEKAESKKTSGRLVYSQLYVKWTYEAMDRYTYDIAIIFLFFFRSPHKHWALLLFYRSSHEKNQKIKSDLKIKSYSPVPSTSVR